MTTVFHSRVQATILLLTTGLLLSGCREERTAPPPSEEPALTRQHREGPLLLQWSLSRTNLTMVDQLTLRLDLHAPAEAEVIFPDLNRQTETWAVSGSYVEPPEKQPGNRMRHRKTWQLVPTRPGDMMFSSLEVEVDGHLIRTEPVQLAVQSLLNDTDEAAQLRDIAPLAEELEAPVTTTIPRWLAVPAALVVAALLWLMFRRRTRQPEILSPGEAAHRALDKLPEDETERLQALTHLMIHYLRDRFALPLDGKTVPELIPVVAAHDDSLPADALIAFFESGRDARFAGRLPDGMTAAAEQTVRKLIDQMEEEAACD